MNKRGNIAMEVLIVLTAVVLTSAVVFLLVRYDVIKVKEVETASVLDTEFIPYMREGYLVIKEFQFCEFVNEDYGCVVEKEEFELGNKIYFRFVVESSTVDGEVMLTENYRVKGPKGNVLLEVDEKYNNYFERKTSKENELIPFKDYLVGEEGDETGEYTLELFIENPLLNKKVTLIKKFEIA